MRQLEKDSYIKKWQQEEKQPFTGWDFSYLDGRMFEEQPPWSYEAQATDLLHNANSVLDLGTGGGENFLKLKPHWPPKVVVTEDHPPNLKLATERLAPLGVRVENVSLTETGLLPFTTAEFDLILNRHAAFNPGEVARILSPGGTFLSQQIHGLWAYDLLALFDAKPQWPNATPQHYIPLLAAAGFQLETVEEWSGTLTFTDVGAIVYYLKAVPWLVPNFSVKRHAQTLLKLQYQLDRGQSLTFQAGKYLLRATLPPSTAPLKQQRE